jgi:hypothetical protein
MEKILNLLWHNAKYSGEDWGLTGWGWVVVGIIGLIVVIKFSIWVYNAIEESNIEENKKLAKLGYKDKDDIEVFLDKIDSSMYDFLRSKGLRKQYELFTEGVSSDFIKNVISNKKAKEAEGGGLMTGLVIGTAAGMTINHK